MAGRGSWRSGASKWVCGWWDDTLVLTGFVYVEKSMLGFRVIELFPLLLKH